MARVPRPWYGLCLGSFVLLGACDSPVETPPGPPTLLVANPLCSGVQCRTLQIRAFVWAFQIPQPPMGIKVIGEVDEPTECLPFAESWELVVTGVDSAGVPVQSDTTTWTPDKPIYVTAVDWPDSASDSAALFLLAATETFTPADAPGWTLTFEEDGSGVFPFSAVLVPGDPCVP